MIGWACEALMIVLCITVAFLLFRVNGPEHRWPFLK